MFVFLELLFCYTDLRAFVTCYRIFLVQKILENIQECLKIRPRYFHAINII